MGSKQRCGTCELLVRSSSSALATWGKCTHRTGWVRTHHEACPQHAGERKKGLVRALIALQVAVAVVGYGTFAVIEFQNGSPTSHLVVGAIALAIVAFGVFAWRYDLLSEEPKYGLLDQRDPPPEEEHRWWLDDR